MSITVDFIHDEALVDAVLSQLRANLPTEWLNAENPILGLRRIEFGDFDGWRYSGDKGDAKVSDIVPLIFVRFPNSTELALASGIGGKQGMQLDLAIVHMFGEKQLYESTTNTGRTVQYPRAKAQRAKIVSKAIFTATAGAERKLGDPTLTTSDTSASVIEAIPGGVNYHPPEDMPTSHIYAFSIPLTVWTRTR